MVSISIIYCTARSDFPLISLPDVHQFTPFLDSLTRQTFKDFEVIICDAYYDKRNFDFYKYNTFKIKHLNVNEFSWARKKGLWGIADGFNLGIIHADGELLLWFGDCSEVVNSDTLQLWWDWYQKGYFVNALMVYRRGNKPCYISNSIKKDVIIDSRWNYVNDSTNGIFYCPGKIFYGYSSTSMEAMLRINGYDSNLDGVKSLEDVDLGMRLEKLGYKLVCDKRLWIVEREHEPIQKEFLWGDTGVAFRSNYSLILLNHIRGKTTANDYKLTQNELEWVIEDGTKWSVPRFDTKSREYELLMDWFKNPPIYDIKELRKLRIKGDLK